MKNASIATKRCAIYTRKSTDHNLDLAFNSLDAQREACEAYIKSQAHEGWKLVAGKYDDGAFSGASLDRPALQELLDQVRANKIDIVVVYKVDRLTRSLTDFAKLVELFDAHNVSFVSITQSFNTTSSMGRLTLNVLLSFAQFEREVIGERVRDKIAASKRKGLWVGGPVPLGYKVIDKKPYVDAEEAKTVQTIFETYLRTGSITGLAAELYRLGIKPKKRAGQGGRLLSAERFQPGALVYLLRNRFYVGEVSYKGQVFAGEHEPLLARDLFDAVQSRLNEQRVDKKVKSKKTSFTLTGKIFDDCDNLMAPSHANKKGVRYRYYVSRALLEGRKTEAGSVTRVSASDVEVIVNNAMAEIHSAESSFDRQATLPHLIRKVGVMQDRIDITVGKDDASDAMMISRPFVSSASVRKGVVDQNKKLSDEPEQRLALLKAIGSARKWMALIIDGKSDIRTLALEANLTERHFRYLLSLAYLSPKMVAAIADGTAPGSWTASNIARNLPLRWSEQERLLQPAS